jgi:hypothetical protein
MIELLVAITVAIIFMGGMLLSRDDFDATVRLGSIAREVALVAREAQTYGAGGGSEVDIGQPHGIHLNSNSQITLYVDQDGDPGYDGDDQTLEQFQLPDRYSIDSFCTTNDASAESCSGSGGGQLSVYFERPSLAANFHDGSSVITPQKAIIDIIHEESGNTRSVVVNTTGYITVP